MLDKIKAISWQGWGVIGGGAIVLLALPAILFSVLDVGNIAQTGLISPWSNATALSTQKAIEAFSGNEAAGKGYLTYHILALIGILIYYILGPGLLITHGITSSSNKSELDETPSAMFKTGLLLTIAGILTFGIEAILVSEIYKNTRQSAANSIQKDEMRQQILKMGINTYEYFILPDSLGGNGGSFSGITKKIAMDGIDAQPESYRLETVSDTLLKIVGKKPTPHNTSGEDSTHLILHVHSKFIWDWKKSD